MIKKVMIVGKQMFLASKAPDPALELGITVDLEFPMQKFWQLEEMMKELTFLITNGEAQQEVSSLQKKIFRFCVPFAYNESSRTYLLQKVEG